MCVNREYQQAYYQANKVRLRPGIDQRKQAHRQKTKEFIDTYKLEQGCGRCGYSKSAAALDAHHYNGEKEFMIAKARDLSLERIQRELDKCEIVCTNCHRELHASVA